MAISITEPEIEQGLEELAQSLQPVSNKRAVTLAVLARVARMGRDELQRFLNSADPTPAAGNRAE